MREISVDEIISINIKDNETSKLQPKQILARSLCAKIQLYSNKEKMQNRETKKNYEIYKIIIDGNEEIFTANIKYLPKNNCNNQELYFDKDIALEISKILNSINDSALKSCPEIMEEYQYEIYVKEKQLQELKILDELKFKKNIKKNELVEKGLLVQKEDKYDIIQKEKTYLQEQVKKYRISNKKLMKRLEISMNKYEEMLNKRNNVFNKVLLKFSKK